MDNRKRKSEDTSNNQEKRLNNLLSSLGFAPINWSMPGMNREVEHITFLNEMGFKPLKWSMPDKSKNEFFTQELTKIEAEKYCRILNYRMHDALVFEIKTLPIKKDEKFPRFQIVAHITKEQENNYNEIQKRQPQDTKRRKLIAYFNKKLYHHNVESFRLASDLNNIKIRFRINYGSRVVFSVEEESFSHFSEDQQLFVKKSGQKLLGSLANTFNLKYSVVSDAETHVSSMPDNKKPLLQVNYSASLNLQYEQAPLFKQRENGYEQSVFKINIPTFSLKPEMIEPLYAQLTQEEDVLKEALVCGALDKIFENYKDKNGKVFLEIKDLRKYIGVMLFFSVNKDPHNQVISDLLLLSKEVRKSAYQAYDNVIVNASIDKKRMFFALRSHEITFFANNPKPTPEPLPTVPGRKLAFTLRNG